MRRHAYADVVLPAGDEILGERRALEDHREWPGPVALRERARGLRHFARPCKRAVGAIEVHDHWMIGRPALHRIQAGGRLRARGIGAPTRNPPRRKRDPAAGPQPPSPPGGLSPPPPQTTT